MSDSKRIFSSKKINFSSDVSQFYVRPYKKYEEKNSTTNKFQWYKLQIKNKINKKIQFQKRIKITS